MKKAVVAGLAALWFIQFVGCDNKDSDIQKGKSLSVQYCSSCHQKPNPGLLDKKTWTNFVLPKMGGYLGFRRFQAQDYYQTKDTSKAMKVEDWASLVKYYVTNAPDSLDEKEQKEINIQLQLFDPSVAAFNVEDPATTYVGIQNQNGFLFADGRSQQLYHLSSDGVLADSIRGGEGVTNISINGAEIKMLSMGVLHPSDDKAGKLTIRNSKTNKTYTLLDSLQRPVFAEYNYLNEDSLQDIIVSEFGNNSGQLSWFENKGKEKFVKHILRGLPGAVRSQTADLNRDGKLDIVALMAQGDEGLFIYYNNGGGRFEEKRILRFAPSFGSNYFELIDFNKDGFLDVLATNGDNGDYPPILKPYHGIRIYLNDGKDNFSEKLFLPMHGACKAITKDFDGDGDLDIASISFFPDYSKTPNESFIYWENRGNDLFQAATFKEANAGRWLVMDTGDIDDDGDIDIVLGNAKFSLGNVPKWQMDKWNLNAPSVLILKNLKHTKH